MRLLTKVILLGYVTPVTVTSRPYTYNIHTVIWENTERRQRECDYEGDIREYVLRSDQSDDGGSGGPEVRNVRRLNDVYVNNYESRLRFPPDFVIRRK